MPTTRSGEVVKRKRKLEAPAACPASAKTEFADPGANEWSEHTSYASATPEVQTRSLLLDSASKACPTSLSITRAGFKRQHGVSNLGAPQQDPLQQGDTGATPSTAACAGLAGLETPLAQQSSLQPSLCNGEPSTCLYGNSLGHRSAADTPALNAIEPAIQMSTDGIKRGLTYSSLAATDTPPPPCALVSEPIASRTPFTTSPNHTVSTEDPSSQNAIEPCSMQTSDENRLWQERAAPAACPPVVSPEALAARLFDSSDPQAATAALLRLLMQSLPDHAKQSLPHAALHLQQARVLTQVGANTSAPGPSAPCFSSRPSPSPGSSSQHTPQWAPQHTAHHTASLPADQLERASLAPSMGTLPSMREGDGSRQVWLACMAQDRESHRPGSPGMQARQEPGGQQQERQQQGQRELQQVQREQQQGRLRTPWSRVRACKAPTQLGGGGGGGVGSGSCSRLALLDLQTPPSDTPEGAHTSLPVLQLISHLLTPQLSTSQATAGSHGSCATTGHVQCGLAPGASGEQQGEEGGQQGQPGTQQQQQAQQQQQQVQQQVQQLSPQALSLLQAGAHAGGLNLSGADLRMLLMLYTQQQQQQHQHEQQQQFSSQQLQQAMLGAEHLFEVQSQSPFAQTSQQQLQQQQQLLPQLLQRSTPFSAVPAVAPEEKSQPPQLTQPPQLPHPQHAWGAQLPSPLALPYPVLSGDCQAGSPVGLAPEQFSSPMDAEVVAHAPVLEERMSDSAQAAMPRPCPAATQQPLPQPTPLEVWRPAQQQPRLATQDPQAGTSPAQGWPPTHDPMQVDMGMHAEQQGLPAADLAAASGCAGHQQAAVVSGWGPQAQQQQQQQGQQQQQADEAHNLAEQAAWPPLAATPSQDMEEQPSGPAATHPTHTSAMATPLTQRVGMVPGPLAASQPHGLDIQTGCRDSSPAAVAPALPPAPDLPQARGVAGWVGPTQAVLPCRADTGKGGLALLCNTPRGDLAVGPEASHSGALPTCHSEATAAAEGAAAAGGAAAAAAGGTAAAGGARSPRSAAAELKWLQQQQPGRGQAQSPSVTDGMTWDASTLPQQPASHLPQPQQPTATLHPPQQPSTAMNQGLIQSKPTQLGITGGPQPQQPLAPLLPPSFGLLQPHLRALLTHFSSALHAQGTDQPGSSLSTSLTLGSILDALALVQKADAHKAAPTPPPGGPPACGAADAGKAAGAGAEAGVQLAQPGTCQSQHSQGLRPPSLACSGVPDQQPPPAGTAGTAGATIQVGAGATATASAAAAAPNSSGSAALGAASAAAANGTMGLDLAGLLAESETPRPSYPSASSLANSPSSVAAAVAKVLGLCTPPTSSSPTPWLLSPRAPPSQLPTSFTPASATFPAPTTSSDSAPPKGDHRQAAASPHLDLSLLPTLHLDLSSSTQHKAPLPLFNTTRSQGALSHPTRVDWSDPSLPTAPPAAHGACPASLPNTQAAGWSIGGGGGGGGGGGDATAHSSKRSSRSRSRSRTLDTCHSPGLTLSPAPGSARGLGSPDLLACLTLNLDPAGSRHSPGCQAGHSAPYTFDARSPSWGGGGLLGSPSTPGQGLSLGLHSVQKELGLGAGAGQAGGLVGVGCDFRRLSPVLNLCSDPPANVSKGLGQSQGQWGSTWSLPDALPTSNQGLDSPAQQQLPSSSRHQDGCMASQPSSPNLAGLHLQPASTAHRASPLLSLRSQTSQQDTVPRLMLSAPSGDAGQGELDRASTGNTASRPAALSLLNSLALQPHPGAATFSPASMPGGEAGGVGLGHAWPPPLLMNPGGSSTPPTRHGSLSGSQGMRLWASSQGTSGTGPMASEGSSSGASQPGLGGLGGLAAGAGGTGGGAVAGGQFGSGAQEGGSLLPPKPRKPRDPAMISKVQQCAGAIMRMVGTRTIYERQIRETLGNNPDTSKALRLLMTQGKLARVGAGGRGDPFAYKATASGLDALQEMIINTSLAV